MMTPAGYLLKRIVPPPDWLGAPGVVDICSVADCLNDNVVDVQLAWRGNDFGVANAPDVLWDLASKGGVDSLGCTLFYYEVYEQEIASDGWTFDPTSWRPLSGVAAPGVPTAVSPPEAAGARLIGYDVVVFGHGLEHSPLSCNSVAETMPVNEHCLLDSLEAAKDAIDGGKFGGGCEEGTYRVFSVSIVLAGPDG